MNFINQIDQIYHVSLSTDAAESAGGVSEMPFNVEWSPRFNLDCRQ